MNSRRSPLAGIPDTGDPTSVRVGDYAPQDGEAGRNAFPPPATAGTLLLEVRVPPVACRQVLPVELLREVEFHRPSLHVTAWDALSAIRMPHEGRRHAPAYFRHRAPQELRNWGLPDVGVGNFLQMP